MVGVEAEVGLAGGREVGLVAGGVMEAEVLEAWGAGQRSSPAIGPEAEGDVLPRSIRTGLPWTARDLE